MYNNGRTRGHEFNLKSLDVKKNISEFSFPYKTTDKWNSLIPDGVQARSTHKFKNKQINMVMEAGQYKHDSNAVNYS